MNSGTSGLTSTGITKGGAEPGPLAAALSSNANVAELYTPTQVQALNVDTPLLQRNGAGQFTLTLGIRKEHDPSSRQLRAFPNNHVPIHRSSGWSQIE